MGQTVAVHPRVWMAPRVWDRVFFAAMVLLLWATILFGFAKTYFLAGMVRAPLPNLLIHVHGAAFSLWMILLLVQTGLIATKNVKVHQALGLAGFGLAGVMVVLGVLAAVDALRRGGGPPGMDHRAFFIVPISDMLVFSVLVYFAYQFRYRPEWHKRFILIATVTLMGAGIARWPIAYFRGHPPAGSGVLLLFLVMIAGYDLVSLRRVSKATLWASGLLIVQNVVRFPIAMSGPWLRFAGHVRGF